MIINDRTTRPHIRSSYSTVLFRRSNWPKTSANRTHADRLNHSESNVHRRSRALQRGSGSGPCGASNLHSRSDVLLRAIEIALPCLTSNMHINPPYHTLSPSHSKPTLIQPSDRDLSSQICIKLSVLKCPHTQTPINQAPNPHESVQITRHFSPQ